MMMRLRILLPDQVLVDTTATKISAEGFEGAFTLLPRHIDYVTVLVPGLLSYTTPENADVYLAADNGTLVKRGANVWVSVRNAVRSTDLRVLHESVKQQFLLLSEQEQRARAVLSNLEVKLVRRFIDLEKSSLI